MFTAGTRREVDTVFSEETVYSVLVQAHNFGVQLLHLGDADLAERFVSKAMNLSRYAPNRGAEVRDSIQVSLLFMYMYTRTMKSVIISYLSTHCIHLPFSCICSAPTRVC